MKTPRLVTAALISCVFLSGMAAGPASAGETEKDQAGDGSLIQVYTGHTYEMEWSDDAGRNLAESGCPQVELDEETAKAYPGLEEAFDRLNEQKKEDFTKAYQEILEEARGRFQEDPEYTGTFTDFETWNVVRADQHVVSLYGVHTGFSGGAHGFTVYDGVNYDPVSGKQLKLSDFVTDGAAFMEYVKEDLYLRYPEIEEDLTEQFFGEKTIDDVTWTAGWEGINCYFDAYTFGPYAIGDQTILVPFEGNESMFQETVMDVPENYGIEFMTGHPLRAGGREIIVNGNLNEYQSYDGITIILDGEETVFDEDIYAFSITPTYLKADGEEYLYLEYSEENDYEAFDLYRLGEKPERIGMQDLGKGYLYVEEKSLTGDAAMSDPERMLLSARIWLLGTTSGQRLYRVGADGKPEPVEPYFHINDGRALTTKQELTLEEVDEQGNVTGTVTVPAGTSMTRIRTDAESTVDLMTQDGRVLRVTLSGSQFPQTIDGKEVEDLFDGIMFAG